MTSGGELRGASTDAVARMAPGAESLDTPHLAPDVTRATLADIARANALFGGRSAVVWGVDRLVRGTSAQTLTLLDVGAGMGDVASWFARRRQQGMASLIPVVLDRHREAARLCRERALPSVQGDAFQLPLADRSIDIVVASQLLHHFNRAALPHLVRELTRVARVGVVVGDLRRSQVAAAGIWLAAVALRFHAVSRHDGVVSVQRGYTKQELSELLREAGVAATVTARPGFRLVATWRVSDADR
jgi:ubiquinone/menaquinone biosynthesis C-methylase UbiE